MRDLYETGPKADSQFRYLSLRHPRRVRSVQRPHHRLARPEDAPEAQPTISPSVEQHRNSSIAPQLFYLEWEPRRHNPAHVFYTGIHTPKRRTLDVDEPRQAAVETPCAHVPPRYSVAAEGKISKICIELCVRSVPCRSDGCVNHGNIISISCRVVLVLIFIDDTSGS